MEPSDTRGRVISHELGKLVEQATELMADWSQVLLNQIVSEGPLKDLPGLDASWQDSEVCY